MRPVGPQVGWCRPSPGPTQLLTRGSRWPRAAAKRTAVRGLDFARLHEMDPPIRPAAKLRQASGFDRYDSETELMSGSLATWSSAGGPQAQPSAPEPPLSAAGGPAAGATAPPPARRRGRAGWSVISAIAGICSR
ncbi:unnamed protein product [Prorocentrum cordatum]|uniref:Uncharacterized protein n=1 Tax=Prorocentrum cordatum TaxID=2364126 RepID=A0ABN9V200_9DINO|nr:unnamed protein product [Polarella glacialis]